MTTAAQKEYQRRYRANRHRRLKTKLKLAQQQKEDRERLARMVSLAEEQCAGATAQTVNRCQIIRGYAELFDSYPLGKFPWVHVQALCRGMGSTETNHGFGG